MEFLGANELLSAVTVLSDQGATFAIATVVRERGPAAKLLVTEDETKIPPGEGQIADPQWAVREMVAQAILAGKATALSELVVDGERCTVAIEVIRPKPSVVVFGAGHVGQAVALMASMIGYAVTAVDDREAFASRSRLPDSRIELVAQPYEQAARAVRITSNTAVVIVTRGHQYDELCLRSVVESKARYIGMIGSRRRVISVFKQMTQSGVDGRLLERVHAPIGLAIGARSPQEIAVAILAEIIQTFNQAADSRRSSFSEQTPERSH
jgi:xanthine dehydrogenase accessory factor